MKYVHKTALNMLSMSPVTFDKWPNTLKEDHFETPFLLYLEKIYPEQIQTSRSANSVCKRTQTLRMSELWNVGLYSAINGFSNLAGNRALGVMGIQAHVHHKAKDSNAFFWHLPSLIFWSNSSNVGSISSHPSGGGLRLFLTLGILKNSIKL